jgi:uncharacterized protein
VLIYIHGLNSSALSYKAGLVRRRMLERGRGDEFVCLELPDRPRRAIALLEELIRESGPGRTALIGSSLGGYYATWLAERHDVRAVLVNPAVRPYDLLGPALGMQTNLYTGVRYELTSGHVDELREYDVATIQPRRYLLLVSTGDEVLDYTQAVEKYRGSEQVIEQGGDHGFSDFERHLERVLAFCGVGS